MKKSSYSTKIKTKTVLIVDDEPHLSECHAELLQEAGIQSVSFIEPHKLIAYVEQEAESIELIITDYKMPSLTGLQMMRQVHHIKKIPYILYSGSLTDIDDNYNLNQLARLAKPTDFEKIKNMAKDLLSFAETKVAK